MSPFGLKRAETTPRANPEQMYLYDSKWVKGFRGEEKSINKKTTG